MINEFNKAIQILLYFFFPRQNDINGCKLTFPSLLLPFIRIKIS
jgi:hypothetical protein